MAAKKKIAAAKKVAVRRQTESTESSNKVVAITWRTICQKLGIEPKASTPRLTEAQREKVLADLSSRLDNFVNGARGPRGPRISDEELRTLAQAAVSALQAFDGPAPLQLIASDLIRAKGEKIDVDGLKKMAKRLRLAEERLKGAAGFAITSNGPSPQIEAV